MQKELEKLNRSRSTDRSYSSEIQYKPKKITKKITKEVKPRATIKKEKEKIPKTTETKITNELDDSQLRSGKNFRLILDPD